jgi:hypothetical protein
MGAAGVRSRGVCPAGSPERAETQNDARVTPPADAQLPSATMSRFPQSATGWAVPSGRESGADAGSESAPRAHAGARTMCATFRDLDRPGRRAMAIDERKLLRRATLRRPARDR